MAILSASQLAREADPFVGGFVTWHIQDAANIEPGQFYAGVC